MYDISTTIQLYLIFIAVEPLPFMPHTDPTQTNPSNGTLSRQISSSVSNQGTLPRKTSTVTKVNSNNVEGNSLSSGRHNSQRNSTRDSSDVIGIGTLVSTTTPIAATTAAALIEDQAPAEVGMYRKVMLVTPSQPMMSVNICMQFVRIMTGRGMFIAPSARGLGLSSENTDEGVSSRRGGGERKQRMGMDFTPINAEA